LPRFAKAGPAEAARNQSGIARVLQSMTTTTERAGVDRLALAAALVTITLWASAFVGIRAVADDLSAGSLALGRLVVAAIALGIVVAIRPWRRPSGRELLLIAGSGVFWMALYSIALNEAERSVDAGTAAMLVNSGPILIAVFAGIFLGEGFPRRLMIGCVVALLGAAIIWLATSSAATAEANTAFGIALCLLAAVAYAAGVTLQKPALRKVSPLHVTWLACVFGAIACAPFGPALLAEVGVAPASSVAWLLYLGLFPTAIAFITWTFALSRTTAGRLGSTTYLIPPVAILLGWFVLGETPAVGAIVGGGVCIVGVVIARSTVRPWPLRRSSIPAVEPEVS
jgi:drug/metabolite transporter (DMT)-like permease